MKQLLLPLQNLTLSLILLLLCNDTVLLFTQAARVSKAMNTNSNAVGTGTATTLSPLQTFTRTISQSRRHLMAAAAARASSILVMYPVDTLKTRMQMGQKLRESLNRGGLMRGVGGSLVGQVPYGVLTFGSYEVYKDVLMRTFPSVRPVFVYALAAVLGDVTGSGWLCPSEVVKQQMQAGMYSSTEEAVRSIWSKAGFGGFYQGYMGGLARDVPFRVAQLTSYEVVKKMYLNAKEKRQVVSGSKTAAALVELSPIDSAVVGAIAGTFSAGITAPLDKIKTLLMTEGPKYGGSVVNCANSIIQSEGVAGLFTGVLPRVVYIAPSVTIFFVVYEQVQQRLLIE